MYLALCCVLQHLAMLHRAEQQQLRSLLDIDGMEVDVNHFYLPPVGTGRQGPSSGVVMARQTAGFGGEAVRAGPQGPRWGRAEGLAGHQRRNVGEGAVTTRPEVVAAMLGRVLAAESAFTLSQTLPQALSAVLQIGNEVLRDGRYQVRGLACMGMLQNGWHQMRGLAWICLLLCGY